MTGLPAIGLQNGTNVPQLSLPSSLQNITINTPIPLAKASFTVNAPQLNDIAALNKVGENLDIDTEKVFEGIDLQNLPKAAEIKVVEKKSNLELAHLFQKEQEQVHIANSAIDIFNDVKAQVADLIKTKKLFLFREGESFKVYKDMSGSGELIRREILDQNNNITATEYISNDAGNAISTFTLNESRELIKADIFLRDSRETYTFENFDKEGIPHYISGSSKEFGNFDIKIK